MKISKPTVTVAISAYNEQKNIGPFLSSVLKQKEEGFVLQKIIIISDGSTDQTVKNASSFKNKKIEILDHKNRTGKSTRLNQLYSKITSDFLVQSDADVMFSHKYVVRDMIRPLLNNKDVGMCGGNPKPLDSETFIEKAINLTFEAYAPLRKTFRGGDNFFSVDGRLLSYKKELVKKIMIPQDTTANDAFTYFCCLTRGYKYKYVDSAVVYFRSPQTLKDHIRQNSRFLAMPLKMSAYFPKELIFRERHVPATILAKNMLPIFLKYPAHSLYIFVINKYCKLKALLISSKINAKWDMAFTTKRLIGKSYE